MRAMPNCEGRVDRENGARPSEAPLSGTAVAWVITRRRLLLRAASLLGLVAATRRSWRLLPAAAAAAKSAAWDDHWEMEVQLEIAAQAGGFARRPYVAVWIEDKDGVPVKTLALWVQNTGRGPRWIPDLRRWYRGERLRQLADGGNLVATVSAATRMPGTYKLLWNGRDDQGKPVTQGTYVVCVEAAREHGTYQLLRKEIIASRQALRAELGSNVEIRSATVDYRQRK